MSSYIWALSHSSLSLLTFTFNSPFLTRMFRECVTNQTLCQAMRQLASLLKQADDLFQDLGGQVGHHAVYDWDCGDDHDTPEAFDGDSHWLWWLWLIKRTFVCQMSNIHDILMVTSIDNDGSDEKHFPSRLRISRAGQGKCKGGWSICRRGFRSTIPRRRNYVSLFSSNKLADKWRSMYIQCSHSCIVRT